MNQADRDASRKRTMKRAGLRVDFEDIVSRIDLKTFPLPCWIGTWLRWAQHPTPHWRWIMRLEITTTDRDTGEKTIVQAPWKFEASMLDRQKDPEAYVFRFVRDALVKILNHEVDEALHMDGVRRADPHDRKTELSEAYDGEVQHRNYLYDIITTKFFGDEQARYLKRFYDIETGRGCVLDQYGGISWLFN